MVDSFSRSHQVRDPDPGCGTCSAYFDDGTKQWIITVHCPNGDCYCNVNPQRGTCLPLGPGGMFGRPLNLNVIYLCFFEPATLMQRIACIQIASIPSFNEDPAWLVGTIPDQSGSKVSYDINLQRLASTGSEPSRPPLYPPLSSFERCTVGAPEASGLIRYQSCFAPIGQESGFATLAFKYGANEQEYLLSIKIDRSRSGSDLPQHLKEAMQGRSCKDCGRIMRELAELKQMVRDQRR